MQTEAVNHSLLHFIDCWQSAFQPFLAHVAEKYGLLRFITVNVALLRLFNVAVGFRELANAVLSVVPENPLLYAVFEKKM